MSPDPRYLISRFDVWSVLWNGKTHYGAGMLRPHYVHASYLSKNAAIASDACGDEPRARFWCQTSRQVASAPDIGGPQDPPDGLRVAEKRWS